MNIHTFISPEDANSAKRLLLWVENYLTQEHDDIHRPYSSQTICPFVAASIKRDSLYMVFHNEFDGRDAAAIANQISHYVDPFKEAAPVSPKLSTLKALLIVFPNIADRFATVLDRCHRVLKPKMAESGLMIGQFHPRCRERAIHNHGWNAVSRSPIPFMALRNMTIHDVIFLGDDPKTFKSYNKRFGAKFADGTISLCEYHKNLIPFYERAKLKHPPADNSRRKL